LVTPRPSCRGECWSRWSPNIGQSAWCTGVLVLMVYLTFAMTLYLLPPQVQ
jgi:hypothetical protein